MKYFNLGGELKYSEIFYRPRSFSFSVIAEQGDNTFGKRLFVLPWTLSRLKNVIALKER